MIYTKSYLKLEKSMLVEVKMKTKYFEISANKLFEESLKSCIEICEIKTDTVRGKKILGKCIETRDRFCKNCIVKVLVSPFSSDCVTEEAFMIEDKVIFCNDLGKINAANIIGGYIYAIFVDPLDFEMMSTLQMYYADCWLSSFVEVAWKGIQSLLIKESIKDFQADEYAGRITISESYAPGFGGMEMKSLSDIFELMKLYEYGMELQDEYIIIPSKCIIGIYLTKKSILT